MRIGIATGLVVVSAIEKGAIGETMNMASRLQGIAPINTIVLSERTRRLAGGAFVYRDLGPQTLKGLPGQTPAFLVLGVSDAASRFEATTQMRFTDLVGRKDELALLQECWARSQEGDGQVVVLSGEPGIGEGRLLNELRLHAARDGACSATLQCSPYHTHSAFHPHITYLERALKFTRDELAQSRLDKIEQLMVKELGRPLADLRFIAAMLSVPTEARYGPMNLTPQRIKDETLRTLVDIALENARRRPSILVIEDVHWADPTNLEVLDLLIDRLRSVPLLTVLTHRPEFANRWASQGHVTSLALSKLTRQISIGLILKVTGGKPLPQDLTDLIVERTDGAPLFLEELTRALLDSKVLREVDGRYKYEGSLATISVPATLADSLMARLDGHPKAKEIAQVGAAIGREFGHQLLESVAGHSREELAPMLEELTASGLVFRRGTPPEATYMFKHALVQDAAYESLLMTKRQAIHARIVNALAQDFREQVAAQPELLAVHLTKADRIDEAVPQWLKAAHYAVGFALS